MMHRRSMTENKNPFFSRCVRYRGCKPRDPNPRRWTFYYINQNSIGCGKCIVQFAHPICQSSAARGSISVYDIDRGHSLLKTIPTVSGVDDVKGVAVSAATGRLYVEVPTHAIPKSTDFAGI